jgi:hypothetical protein
MLFLNMYIAKSWDVLIQKKDKEVSTDMLFSS